MELLCGVQDRKTWLLKSTAAQLQSDPDPGIQEIIGCGNWNPRLWYPEFSSRNPENLTNNWDPLFRIP